MKHKRRSMSASVAATRKARRTQKRMKQARVEYEHFFRRADTPIDPQMVRNYMRLLPCPDYGSRR